MRPRAATLLSIVLPAACLPSWPPAEHPFFGGTSSGCGYFLAPLIAAGKLSAARIAALDYYLELPEPQRRHECADSWAKLLDPLLEPWNAVDYLKKVAHVHQQPPPPMTMASAFEEPCWEGGSSKNNSELWTSCCAPFLGAESSSVCSARIKGPACCALASGGVSYRLLPLLWEVKMHLWLPSPVARLITIEQDGFLRPFDMPTTLWPAGFLLAQWVGTQGCYEWAGKRVLELGAGVGASSIAAALCGADVVSADKELRALSLVAVNAAINGVISSERRGIDNATRGSLTPVVLDWDSDASVDSLAVKHGPFDMIIGAALQYGKWEARMWAVLEKLAKRPHGSPARVALASGFRELILCSLETIRGNISVSQQCPNGWSVDRRDSGDMFSMADLRGGPSEFEVTVLSRDSSSNLNCVTA